MNFKLDTPTLRLIDANANRAREGLRTAEDYLRFRAGSDRWIRTLKDARHGITSALELALPQRACVSARDTARDPLRADSQPDAAPQAEDPRTVAQRGLKRAQEALRTLEEFLRGPHPAAATQLASIRFSAYDAEQALLCTSPAFEILSCATVYVLLTETLCRTGLLATAEAILKAGIKLIQLREKNPDDTAYFARARDLRSLSREHGAVLICNDRADLAVAADSDGVHVGQKDLPPQVVRKVVGERLIVGRSTHSVEQARVAVELENADYIAIGSLFDTATKPERTLIGPELGRQVAALNLPVPVFGIGGITTERIGELRRTGIHRFAVSSAIISSPHPGDEAKRFLDAAGCLEV